MHLYYVDPSILISHYLLYKIKHKNYYHVIEQLVLINKKISVFEEILWLSNNNNKILNGTCELL